MRIFVIEDRRKIVVRAKLGFATSGVVGIVLSVDNPDGIFIGIFIQLLK